MKLLFVSEFIGEKPQGAAMSARVHYKSLCNILGKDNVDLISISASGNPYEKSEFDTFIGYSSKIELLRNYLSGRPFFIDKKIQLYIIKRASQCDVVFFDNSYYGSILKIIKQKFPRKKIIVNYHGVYINAEIQALKNSKTIGQLLRFWNTTKNEQLTNKYADTQLLLNERDEDVLFKAYHRKADYILPVYFEDTAKINPTESNDTEFRILFVGGHFWPNIHGIRWFAENVMNRLDSGIVLYIVGRGLEELQSETCFQRDNIKVIGWAEDLSQWYNSTDVVVGPIFKGDGMKTKTAEALMYGKIFIGTNESLCGYTGLGQYHCETADEFISLLKKLKTDGCKRYNPAMRQLYEEYYSPAAAERVLRKVLVI